MNAPLPVFYRPPSAERDSTVMRPSNSDDNCLQVTFLINSSQSIIMIQLNGDEIFLDSSFTSTFYLCVILIFGI